MLYKIYLRTSNDCVLVSEENADDCSLFPNPGVEWTVVVNGREMSCEVESLGNPRTSGLILLSQDVFVRQRTP